MIRHCTLKELFVVLPPDKFMRLNKFYLINRIHFLRINENEKLLYLNDNFSIPVPHRISRYVLDILKR
jgi:DNA-binding LytR/AlgR family response regulator